MPNTRTLLWDAAVLPRIHGAKFDSLNSDKNKFNF